MMKKLFLLVATVWVAGLYAEPEDSKAAAIPALPDEDLSAIPPVLDEPAHDTRVVRYDDANNGIQPRYLNALDLQGHIITGFKYFRDPALRTYIPDTKKGTSSFMPNSSIFESGDKNPAQNNFSGNMRLRLDPTINVTEMIKVRSSIDIFGNMPLGSTPAYGPGNPLSLMSMSQVPPVAGQNSQQNSVAVRSAWGEAAFPIGEFRFGRMPFNWGLGILYNSGEAIDNDRGGDTIDGIQFTTRLFDHYFSPSYSIAYTGPVARGGGFFPRPPTPPATLGIPTYFTPGEQGQRYPLESGALTHVFSFSVEKRDSDYMKNKKRQEGQSIFNYGLLASYRLQYLDAGQQADPAKFDPTKVIRRDGDVGLLSWWSSISYKTFHLEAELAGVWGKYHIGENTKDALATATINSRDVWLLQGGAALKSRFGFLDDRLQLGLDGGVASSGPGPGFGIREGANMEPKAGDADGNKTPAGNDFKTNFKFNPNFHVDLLLYREILGGIAGSYYVKPHISYFFSRNFGLRGDVIGAFAIDKDNTTGNANFLGVEADASTFLRTDGGFYFSLCYGVLFPFEGLDHQKSVIKGPSHKNFGYAQTAHTLQFNFGILF
jgi:uncharacterized protein (TIGR04551 family)